MTGYFLFGALDSYIPAAPANNISHNPVKPNAESSLLLKTSKGVKRKAVYQIFTSIIIAWSPVTGRVRRFRVAAVGGEWISDSGLVQGFINK